MRIQSYSKCCWWHEYPYWRTASGWPWLASPDWPIANAERPVPRPLKTAKFLQCISIAFVPKFAYEALCSDCERLATFNMVVILSALARGQSGLLVGMSTSHVVGSRPSRVKPKTIIKMVQTGSLYDTQCFRVAV